MVGDVDRVRAGHGVGRALVGPSRGSGMVGYDTELRTVLTSLEGATPALVSISGAAGSGKSTLAAAAAETLADRGWRVAWVDVASATTPLSIALQRSLAVDDLEPSTLQLATFGRRVVVVLDGADRRSTELAEALAPLKKCRSVRVMLTNIRGIPGPKVVRVALGGLDVPPSHARGSELTTYSSVQLFLSVAAAVGPDLSSDERLLSEVADVCRSLGGLPLAVILAAARLERPLSSASRLSRQVRADPTFSLMLSANRPDSGPCTHHHNVRAALEWTYSLLDPTQQHVLRRTSVFRAPFALEAAEQVCGLSRYKIFEPLEDLMDLRLLEMASDQVADSRFEMHPLVRAFGNEALVASGEAPHCSDLHAAFFADLARRTSRPDDGSRSEANAELRSVEPDLFTALDYLMESGRNEEALRLTADLGHLAASTGHTHDLLARLDHLLADVPSGAERGVLADALLWAAHLGLYAKTAPDTLECSQRRWREGMALARDEGTPNRLLRGLSDAIWALPVTGDFTGAKVAAEGGLRIAREIGHPVWLARFTVWSGMVAHQERDFATAARLATEALGIALRSGDGRSLILVGLLVSGLPTEHAPTLSLLPPLEDLYAMAVDLGDRGGQSWLLGHLTSNANRRGDYQAAASWILRRVDLVRTSTAWHALGFSLLGSVPVLSNTGHQKLAARVHGCLAPNMSVLMAGVAPRHQAAYATTVSRLEAALGSGVFEERARVGSGESWADVLLTVLPVLEDAASKKRSRTSPLTSREEEVLHLLSEGLSNKDIAARLGVSPKTVMHHTVSVYRKLGVRGRSEAAAVAVRMGLSGS